MHRKILSAALMLAVAPVAALAQSAPPSSATPQSAAATEAREKARSACAADVEKYCANIERAKGAMRECLRANEAQLSSACKTARDERAALRAKEKG